MFDWSDTIGALLHAAVLITVILLVCRYWKLPKQDWPFVLFILFWANMVLASQFASALHALNQLDIYVVCSFIGLGLLLLVGRYIHNQPTRTPLVTPPSLNFSPIGDPKIRRYLLWFLGVTFAFVAISSFVLVASVYPDNADSMIYRLPRTFWYVSNGSFMHPFESPDRRVTFYPLCGVALYVPLVLYNLPGTTHGLPSFFAWLMLAYTTYRFARALGAERLIAIFAAWLVAVTPSILAQATSTNDEILTAVSMLTSLYMGWRWLVTGKGLYFLLAAIAMGFSAGTKLHIVFLMPIIFVAMGIAIWYVKKNPKLLRRWFGNIGWRTGITSLAMMLVMFAPFLVYNYLSSGRVYFTGDFAKDVFNLQGNIRSVLQNLVFYVSQMVFSPIADLNSWPVAEDRQKFNLLLNSLINPFILPFIKNDPAYYHMNYRFTGVTIPVSVRFVEFSLWSGFVWLLWPLQARLALCQSFPLKHLFFLLALTPPIWLVLWSMSTLYMEGTATYFTFYLICAAPAAAMSFAVIKRNFWNEFRWVVIFIVALTNIIISTNLLMFSGFRALPDLYYARKWPFDWDLFDQPIIDEIRRAERIRVILTHDKMPYFAFMHWNPKAKFYSPYFMKDMPEAQSVMQIMPTPSYYEYGFMPLKIPGKETPGVTYLGTIRGIGREVIFAMGNNLEKRWPTESDYIVPHIPITPVSDGYVIASNENVAGLRDEDNLEFSYALTMDGQPIFSRPWGRNPAFAVKVQESARARNYQLTIKVRSAWSHKVLTEGTYQVGGVGVWLPEGNEY